MESNGFKEWGRAHTALLFDPTLLTPFGGRWVSLHCLKMQKSTDPEVASRSGQEQCLQSSITNQLCDLGTLLHASVSQCPWWEMRILTGLPSQGFHACYSAC